jgi:hypothetical protein
MRRRTFAVGLALFSLLLIFTNRHFELARARETAIEGLQTADRASSKEWRFASFRGLMIGKSTQNDMVRILGDPERSIPPGDQPINDPDPEVWNDYSNVGEAPGTVTVIVKRNSGLIVRIDLYPTNLSKAQAIELFGTDYVPVRYAHDDCLGNGESAPIYEALDGPILNIEYRQRGISIGIGAGDVVNVISYISGPIGASYSRCRNGRSISRATNKAQF